ncbi:hypothetical protein FB45DRAFT_926185 [Roridomyces roridus]|uniref:Uncharacterized protein n=1 Tax=Roridomyces roridus TaxID=1738132 RepID=A0AAD7FH41_9AGAR|nr:hypothetical protein FB45DRAFT_926185 [Roridomyces roridus]
MLRRRSGSWAWITPRILSLCLFLVPSTYAAVNVSVQNTDPDIVYTPFICDASTPGSSNNPNCTGGWNATQVGTIHVVSTTGPDPDGGSIIPQMFMAFHASALYMSTSTVDTTAGLVVIIGLDESVLTTLTITYDPGTSGSNAVRRLDIGAILLTVTDPNDTTSFLPSMTLPSSTTLPTFVPQTSTSTTTSASASSTTSQSPSQHIPMAEVLGLAIGLGLGLTTILGVAAFFVWWHSRLRRQHTEQSMQWS